MLIARFGTTQTPFPEICSFCPKEMPANEDLFFLEVEPDRDDKKTKKQQEIVLRQFEIMCWACYTAIREAIIRHGLPIEDGYVPDAPEQFSDTEYTQIRLTSKGEFKEVKK